MSDSDSFDEIEEQNLEEIERLNQRGGRTLSFVDLIEAGTVSSALAGELAACVESGASILTAARRGGAGKSTLLADLLACLPPGERIVTTPDIDAVEAAVEEAAKAPPAAPTCFLAHEIGSGPWYAYLWGRSAAGFFALARGRARIATCLHADELDELHGILESQGVDPEDVRSIGLLAFIKNARRGRRVESVYMPGPGGHRVRWLRDEIEDIFLADGPDPVPAERADELAEVFESLADRGIRSFADVRRELAAVLRTAGNVDEGR
jgi:hypothetical protein